MASEFLLQIVWRETGEVVQMEPGGAVEVDLVNDLTERLLEQPVGVFTTRAGVSKIVGQTLRDAIHALKQRI